MSGMPGYYLAPCPFCGTEPDAEYIGNEATKFRSIIIRCPKCRVQRKDSAVKQGFHWLESVAQKHWNQRYAPDAEEKS